MSGWDCKQLLHHRTGPKIHFFKNLVQINEVPLFQLSCFLLCACVPMRRAAYSSELFSVRRPSKNGSHWYGSFYSFSIWNMKIQISLRRFQFGKRDLKGENSPKLFQQCIICICVSGMRYWGSCSHFQVWQQRVWCSARNVLPRHRTECMLLTDPCLTLTEKEAETQRNWAVCSASHTKLSQSSTVRANNRTCVCVCVSVWEGVCLEGKVMGLIAHVLILSAFSRKFRISSRVGFTKSQNDFSSWLWAHTLLYLKTNKEQIT